MKGVIYARYSSDNQREESIDGQVRECKAYAKKNDIEIVEIYIDRALSAKTDKRPDFQRMVKDSGNRTFDVIIVWKLDRFSRKRYDSLYYKQLLGNNGVKVISATEIICSGSAGIMSESMLESMAEYFSAELSEKVKRGHTENTLKRKYNGGTLPLGYRIDENHEHAIDPLTAPAVLEAFEQYADGLTIKEIAAELNRKGLKSRRGGEICMTSVTIMLRNRKYIGEFRYDDYTIPGGMPAIVPTELFDKVQERISLNKRAPAMHKAEDEYLLTTKLFCGKCQCLMVGESGTARNKTVHRYYKCISAKRKRGCDKRAVKKEWIEELVIEQIKAILFDDALMERIAKELYKKQGEENTTIPILKKQLGNVNKSIENIMKAIEAGVLTKTTKSRLEALEQEQARFEAELIREQAARPTYTKDEILFWILQFRKLDTTLISSRRKLINCFVNAVFVFDDKIVFTLNFKDGTKTIRLSDIEASAIGSDIKGFAPPKSASNDNVACRFFISALAHKLFSLCAFFIPKNKEVNP
ncbi:MAG: recombinase family protein [Acutalibacteraceae bacterium]